MLLNFLQSIPYVIFYNWSNENVFICIREHLLINLQFFKKHFKCQFNLLTAISGVDLMDSKYRFVISYELLSIRFNQRFRIKIFLSAVSSIISSCSIYICANWWEREVWDLFGIKFLYHPDLRRILTDYGFEGFPLRKDFPLSGFMELEYNLPEKRVVYSPIELSQDFRIFHFENSW